MTPTPEELHDWNRDRHGLDGPRSNRDLWIAGLVGVWAGGLAILMALAFQDSLIGAGALHGCETLTASECTAFAQERSR